MSFITMDFAFFVCLALLLYYLMPKDKRWWILLIASYAFYTVTGVWNLVYILLSTVTTFVSARLIERYTTEQKAYLQENKDTLNREEKKAYKSKVKSKQRLILVLCVVINIGVLIFFKYSNWAIANINLFRLSYFGRSDFIPFLDIVLPLGISFYTLITVGYLIDIYYGKYEAATNPFKYALFVSFFPQLVQGPVSRYNQTAEQLIAPREFDFDNIRSGFFRTCWGLFKKLVIADRLAGYVSNMVMFKEENKGLYLIIGLFFYSLQIYGDFSGGIDVAIGVGEMFGVKLPENFERPFFSKSISEYWRRWHITLGTWFKDYIFYPLSINKHILKWGKWLRTHGMETVGKRLPIYLPMIAVWITTGMWHGSEGKYVFWGLMNCLFIILGTEAEPISGKITARLKLKEESFGMKLYRVVKTFWLMAFLRVFDITENTREGLRLVKFSFMEWGKFDWDVMLETYGMKLEDYIVAIVAILVVLIVSLIQRSGSVREKIFKMPTVWRWVILSALVGVTIVFGYYGLGYDAQSFIYGNF